METFLSPRNLVKNADFQLQRRRSLGRIDLTRIDPPIIDLVTGFGKLNHCFTLQSCYGHFLYADQQNHRCTEPIKITDLVKNIEYRIAYIALCVANTHLGRAMLDDLGNIPSIDPQYIQFGCAEWFWERQANSFALQVMPRRHMTKDQIHIGYHEAIHIEKIRKLFFSELSKLIQ